MVLRLRNILKQKKTGHGWGAFIQLISQLSPVIWAVNIALLAPTAWETVFRDWLYEHGLYLSFTHFMLMLVALFGVTMVVLYKLGLPSFFSFFNSQFWQHDNPMAKKMEDISKGIKGLEDRMDKLEKTIKGTE